MRIQNSFFLIAVVTRKEKEGHGHIQVPAGKTTREKRAIRKENTTMLNTRIAVTAVTAQVLVIPAALNPVGVRKRRERKRDNTTIENTTRSKRSERQKKTPQEAPIFDRGRYQA